MGFLDPVLRRLRTEVPLADARARGHVPLRRLRGAAALLEPVPRSPGPRGRDVRAVRAGAVPRPGDGGGAGLDRDHRRRLLPDVRSTDPRLRPEHLLPRTQGTAPHRDQHPVHPRGRRHGAPAQQVQRIPRRHRIRTLRLAPSPAQRHGHPSAQVRGRHARALRRSQDVQPLRPLPQGAVLRRLPLLLRTERVHGHVRRRAVGGHLRRGRVQRWDAAGD